MGDFQWEWNRGEFYVGGYCFMLAHFAAINVGLIDREGIMGTGTTTVLSWLIVSIFTIWLVIVLRSPRLPVGERELQ